MSEFKICKAEKKDSEIVLNFIKELAEFEKELGQVTASKQEIEETLFSQNPKAHALLCYENEKAIGCAIYFFNYSTWLGTPGLFLDDLYILPEHRGSGSGAALLKYPAGIAVA